MLSQRLVSLALLFAVPFALGTPVRDQVEVNAVRSEAETGFTPPCTLSPEVKKQLRDIFFNRVNECATKVGLPKDLTDKLNKFEFVQKQQDQGFSTCLTTAYNVLDAQGMPDLAKYDAFMQTVKPICEPTYNAVMQLAKVAIPKTKSDGMNPNDAIWYITAVTWVPWRALLCEGAECPSIPDVPSPGTGITPPL